MKTELVHRPVVSQAPPKKAPPAPAPTLVPEPTRTGAAGPEPVKPAPLPAKAPPTPTAAGPSTVPVAAGPAPAVRARATLFEALFKDMGEVGTELEHPRGKSFFLRREMGEGAVHTQRSLTVPLPWGGAVTHDADVAIELEDGRIVYVDVFDAHGALEELKAAAYDTLHLKQARVKPFAVLVVVHSPRSLIRRGTVEALAYPYDYVFSVDEENVVLELKFAACRAEIMKRVRAPS